MENVSELVATQTWLTPDTLAEWELNLTTLTFQSLENNKSTNESRQVFYPCNNPENLIDETTAKQVTRLLYMTVLALLELFGVTTNVINVIVFVRQGLKDRINLCLFSLALADISFLLLIFSAKFFSFLGLFDKELEEYWEAKHLEIVLPYLLATLAISNLMTMLISVERCVCVVFPFTAKKFLKTRYMAVIIVIVAVYMLISHGVSMQFIAIRVTDPVTNTSHWVVGNSDFVHENRIVLDIVFGHQLPLTIPLISLIVVIVTTFITIVKLRQSLAWRHKKVDSKVSEGERREAAVTKMLTVICLIYVITMTPSVTQAFFRTLYPDYAPGGKYCNTFKVIQTLAHICEVTNSGANFIVYFAMGTKFRDTVRQLFGTWQERKESHAEHLHTASQHV